jgi:hypothetical protein
VTSVSAGLYWIATCDKHRWRGRPSVSKQRADRELEEHRWDPGPPAELRDRQADE